MPKKTDDGESEDDSLAEIQDNRREQQMRDLLKLQEAHAGRYGADAVDEFGHEFELKSTTKQSVSTARDVGLHTLQKWRERYWVFAKGTNRKRSGFHIAELYFLHPSDFDEWLQRYETLFRRDLQLLDRLTKMMRDAALPSTDIERVQYLIQRGYTLNNPHIPWVYVQTHGTNVGADADPAGRLRELVAARPIR